MRSRLIGDRHSIPLKILTGALAAFAFALPLLAMQPARAASSSKAPIVDVVEVSGLIDTTMANYIGAEIKAANESSSELLVMSISSPGGLNVSTDSLVNLMNASNVPIAVYVGPQRARAAGTAAILVAAANIAAIGPSAQLGPANPTNLAVDPKSDRGKLLGQRVSLLLDQLQRTRGRQAGIFADKAIPASVALREGQVDMTVVSVAELLERSNGRSVTTANGDHVLRLDKNLVEIRFHKPGPWPRLLHTLVIPSLVYVLLVTGVLLVVFEIFQPGFGVAGVTGMLLLVGAIYGLFVLPVALWALAVFVLACLLLSVDVALDGIGPPTYLGLIGFVIGSAKMFAGPAPELEVRWWLALLGVIIAFIFFVPVMTIVKRARKAPQRTADPALVGLPGQVRSILNPEGYVWVADALWRARSVDEDRIRVGEDVTVTGVDGALLTVRRL
ncbi:MAG: NfeD family protein [Actinomycetota bacterium]